MDDGATEPKRPKLDNPGISDLNPLLINLVFFQQNDTL